MFTVTNITIINEHSVFNVQKKNIWSMLILQLLNFNTTNSSNFKKKKCPLLDKSINATIYIIKTSPQKSGFLYKNI